jgi:hypothetical protein
VLNLGLPCLQAVMLDQASSEVTPSESRLHEHGSSDLLRSRFRSEAGNKSLKGQTWAIVTDPNSSDVAAIWGIFICCVIVLANVFFIIDTDPAFYRPPGAPRLAFMFYVDVSTTCIFTLEILATIWSAPSIRQLYDIAFVVDIVVVLPSYVEFITGGKEGGPSLAILRVFRLLRVLRLFRVSRSSTTLLVTAMKRSMRMLIMLVMLLAIVVTVLGAAMHAIERGSWDPVRREWRREIMWECLYDVNVRPDGTLATLSGTTLHMIVPACVLREVVDSTRVVYACMVPVETGRACVSSAWDRSPFGSIPAAAWWALVTISTVGALPSSETAVCAPCCDWIAPYIP